MTVCTGEMDVIGKLYLVGMGAVTGLLTAAACGHVVLWVSVGMAVGFVWSKAQPEESKMFFSEEKNQKTFDSSVLFHSPAKSRIYQWVPETKVFCFFSSEKKTLLFGVAAHGWPRRSNSCV